MSPGDVLYLDALLDLARREVEAGRPLFGPEAWAAWQRQPGLLAQARLAPGTWEYLRQADGASRRRPG